MIFQVSYVFAVLREAIRSVNEFGGLPVNITADMCRLLSELARLSQYNEEMAERYFQFIRDALTEKTFSDLGDGVEIPTGEKEKGHCGWELYNAMHKISQNYLHGKVSDQDEKKILNMIYGQVVCDGDIAPVYHN